MKKDLLILSFVFCLSVVAGACKKDKAATAPLFLKTDSAALGLKPAAGSRDSFSIQSNTDWAISINPASAASWVKLSVSSGSGTAKVYVTTETANTGATAQSATIIINPVNNQAVPAISIPVNQRTFQVNKVLSKLYGGAADDRFNAITPCGDGAYLAVGYSYSYDGDIAGNKGRSEFWIVKINGSGDKIWSKTYGGAEGDQATAVARTTDGGYIIAGQSRSTDGDVVGGHGSDDVWVVKIDANGNRLWAKAYGGLGYEFASDVIATPDGGSLVVGGAGTNNGDVNGSLGGMDMWAIRLDANGNKLWAKNVGTSSDETAASVAATPDGGYVLLGDNFSSGGSDALVVKIDAGGNQQWTKTFGGASQDFTNKIIVTTDGGYLFVGSTTSNDGDVSANKGNYDVWAVKLDVKGNKVWSQTYGGSSAEEASTVITTADNGFLVAGSSGSNDGDVSNAAGYDDMWVLKLDAAGKKLWAKTFGGNFNDAASAAYETAAGSFILAGTSDSNNGAVSGSHGSRDGWLLKVTE